MENPIQCPAILWQSIKCKVYWNTIILHHPLYYFQNNLIIYIFVYNLYHLGEYECTRSGCNWDNFTSGIDWGYYYENYTTVNGIDKCKSYCSDDHSCGAFEWTLHYCSWWKYGKCQNESDATMNNTRFTTCRKSIRTFHYCYILHSFIVTLW